MNEAFGRVVAAGEPGVGGDEGSPPTPGEWMFCVRCDALQNKPLCDICSYFDNL